MDDMQDILKQLSSMIDKNDISDNFKDIINNLSSKQNSSNNEDTNNSPFGNIDMNTLLKMKSIMDGMNTKNDPRANLLLSLKPYLKDSRKSKVDQYMQFLNMSKLFEMMQHPGGDTK